MKSISFLSLSSMAFVMSYSLTACSSDEKPFVDNEPVAVKDAGGSDVVKGISVSLSDFALADATTRTAYSDVDGGMRVIWAAGDTIGIFPNVGGQVEFPIQEGTESNQAVFDGGGWALKSNSTYAAYYPFSKWNVFRDNETISLVYTGQTQADNGSSAHLGKYDYQATGGVTTNSSGYLNFQFKHLGALMAFNLTVPKAGTYTSLTLTSSEDVFVTKAELDISGQTPVLKPTETSNTFTLSLDDIELQSNNAELTAYMMLAPVDLSQGSLELSLNGSSNYRTSLDGHSLDAGKQYTISSSFDESSINSLTFTVNGVSFTMVQVEGGTFMMGASDDDSDAFSNERPQHEVTLSSFAIGQTEVTQALWMAVMGENPSYFKGDDRPVEFVSWNDCQTFIQKLNELTGKNFRLPTEAEWEYAARGGNQSQGYKYAGSNNLGNVAWYIDNSGYTAQEVGTKLPNELGLYDMSGNVLEWCQDWYGDYSSTAQTNPQGPSTGSDRVLREGSWLNFARSCRVSHRFHDSPSYRSNNLGFRLAL